MPAIIPSRKSAVRITMNVVVYAHGTSMYYMFMLSVINFVDPRAHVGGNLTPAPTL